MNFLYFYYAAPLLVILALYIRRHRRLQRADAIELKRSLARGLAEPPSLHPVIDPGTCIGSGSCVRACPEQALGIVDGKAVLKNGSACIGHGACLAACPVQAITLVFGTKERGVDIPQLSPTFESNVPGIFIAGELGGMGLIRKAAEQGRQAIEAIRQRARDDLDYDVIIIGGGPAGLAAGLTALQHRLRYKIVEQEATLGGTIFHYPRNKITMSAPLDLPLVGKVDFGSVDKETLLEFWREAVRATGLQVSFHERFVGLEKKGRGFRVHTSRGRYTTRSLLLAVGRRGTPKQLDVPGEDLPKVVYRLVDEQQYRDRSVLVVGGGNAALEAAIALARQPSTDVILSYRGASFVRARPENQRQLNKLEHAGRLRVLLNSSVRSIAPDSVQVDCSGKLRKYANDAVILCLGGEMPKPLLESFGIEFDTKFGTV